MKRDWDVIREVLIEVEALDTHTRDKAQYSVTHGQPADTDLKAEHALMLWEAGFIDASDAGADEGPALLSPKLTWQGHDLLETMRSPRVWNRIKTVAEEKGVELTFDAVKALSKAALDWVLTG